MSKNKKLNREEKVTRDFNKMIFNGLTEAVLGFNPETIGVQLSQTSTLFKNNRWYLASNFRQLLSQIYVEHGLVQTIVDVPVEDAFRGGIEIKSDDLDPNEIEELLMEMDEEGDLQKLAQAYKWNRLFGGAGVIIITDQDFTKPLDIESIKKDTPLEFRAVDMWELFWTHQNTSDTSLSISAEELETERYDYYGKQLHRSRVIRLKGKTAPSFVRPRLRGWGLSCIEPLVRSINQYLKACDLMFEVLDEFKIDVYKIKNLANTLMSPKGEEAIRKRVMLANQQKNYQNAVTMDGEDDYVAKELSFAGISETFTGIRTQIASDMRMPLTKIFGISAAGFSSGEDDIENYNAMVESQIRTTAKFDLIKIIKIRCQKKFGYTPEHLTVTFKPLRILSSEQEENVKTQKHSRLLAAATAGFITPKEYKEACNKDQLLGIQVDVNQERLEVPSTEGAGGEAPKAPESKIKAPQAKS